MTTLPMHYFGRGSARMMMPRAVARHERREWPVSPSFLILLLSLAFLSLHRLVIDRPLTLKRTRTLILMPHTPSLPLPTVKESLPIFTVIKEAAQKSVKPRKREPSPTPHLQKKAVKKQSIAKPPRATHAAPALPRPKPPTAIAPLQASAKRPMANLLSQPMATPLPVLAVGKGPTTLVPKASTRLQVAVTTRPRETAHFSPLPLPRSIKTLSGAAQSPPKKALLGTYQTKTQAPLLAPLSEAPRGLTRAHKTEPPPATKRAEKPHTRPIPNPIRRETQNPKGEQVAAHHLVQIKGSNLGASLRVKALKEEIYRKTGHLNITGSPYTYRVGHYRCQVIIGHGEHPVTTLIFDPTDAPFDVVSALERLLPRRAAHP